jgi:hypothetical protein
MRRERKNELQELGKSELAFSGKIGKGVHGKELFQLSGFGDRAVKSSPDLCGSKLG